MENEKVQDFDDTQEESQEETSEEESQEETFETEEEKTGEQTRGTADESLIRGLQKGYTSTRQDLSQLKQDIEAIKEAVERKSRDEFGYEDEEKPLTRKELQDIFVKEREAKVQQDVKLDKQIDGQLADLYAQGLIKNQKEENELLEFAIKHKILDLHQSVGLWRELYSAKKEGQKEGLKGKVRQEEGSKVGTSQKATGEERGISYQKIHSKDFFELVEE